MAELNIKKEIGKRILEARKAKGLTLKALGELAGDLKQTRLTNWEQGTRTPGPEEIKLLAKALDVSPAFLMCLSDEQQVRETKKHSHLIPLLDQHQACDAESYFKAIRERGEGSDTVLISVSTELLPNLSHEAFALKMMDESMTPEFRVGDMLIISPDAKVKPTDFVVAKLEGEDEVVIRKYKQLWAEKTATEFELVALNKDWADIKVSSDNNTIIVGLILYSFRRLK